MSISRSKSAPQPISSSYGPDHDEEALETTNRKVPIPRAHSSQAISPFVPPHRRTRRTIIDREDPFSLSTFFPSPFGRAGERERDWHWLRGGDSDGLPLYGEHEPERVPTPANEGVTGGILFGKVEDELAGESIKDEDKLGVLSLDKPLGTLLVSGIRDLVGI